MHDALIERGILFLDMLRRRWKIIAVTVAVVTALAFTLVKTTPARFTTSVTIALKSANQSSWAPGSSQFPDQNAIEQVRAIEVWLKSDHVLEDLLPQLLESQAPLNPRKRLEEMTKLRAALRLSPVGTSMIRLDLDGSSPDGLSRKLEIILSSFLERLLRSDDGVLSAAQFIMLRRGDDANTAEKMLVAEIQSMGLDPIHVIRQLQELRRLTAPRSDHASPGTKAPPLSIPRSATAPSAAEVQIRNSISSHGDIVRRFEHFYENALRARGSVERAQTSLGQKDGTFIRIFESPENLTIIGRPRDPLIGENPMRKVGIAMILLSFGIGLALAFLADMLDRRMRMRNEFETLSELPVIARLPRVPT